MSSVASRTLRSSPHRDNSATWDVVVNLLTCGQAGDRRRELEAVAGIAASLIAEQAPKDAPIVATCDGPRTRIYCIYGEDALDAGAGNEAMLGFDALAGDWQVSLPCPEEDLAWVQASLKKKSSRIVARSVKDGFVVEEEQKATSDGALSLNVAGFLSS